MTPAAEAAIIQANIDAAAARRAAVLWLGTPADLRDHNQTPEDHVFEDLAARGHAAVDRAEIADDDGTTHTVIVDAALTGLGRIIHAGLR